MEKRRNYIINAIVCDAQKVREETLSSYERISINATILLVNAKSKALLDRYGVQMNVNSVLEMEEEVQVRTINGRGKIAPSQGTAEGKTILIINGRADIAPGSQEVLRSYAKILVNGSVTCPESLVYCLGNADINGSISTYPDDCIPLEHVVVLDRTFHLRVREGARYYVAKRVIALQGGISFDKMVEKNVSFFTKDLLVCESLVETAVPLFNETVDITVLPDGCAYVDGDAILDANLLARYGGKLFVHGNLTVPVDSAPVLDDVSFLRVDGVIFAVKRLLEAVNRLRPVCESIRPIGGVFLNDRVALTVTRDMLEAAEDGVSINDCVTVKFADDIPAGLLRERLVSLTDCVTIEANAAQRPVLENIVEGVVSFGDDSQINKAEDLLEAMGLDASSLSPEERERLMVENRFVKGTTVVL